MQLWNTKLKGCYAMAHWNQSLPKGMSECCSIPLQVAVRVRPRLPRDSTDGGLDTTADGECKVVASGHEPFTFSRTFGPDATQMAVYNHCAAPQVAAVLDGIDACIFALGQTGAGKTYSMLGPGGGTPRPQDGLIVLSAAEIFRGCQST